MKAIPLPMLSNPPAFLVLTLVFAVAAYLRQVSENAVKLRNEIRNGNWSSVYPLDALHTKEKLRLLQKTRDKLAKVAPWLVWFAVLIAMRCFAHAIVILSNAFEIEATRGVDLTMRWTDAMITWFLFVVLVVLGIMHHKNRSDEACLRRLEELTQGQDRQPAVDHVVVDQNVPVEGI
jgi:hypothetical protein